MTQVENRNDTEGNVSFTHRAEYIVLTQANAFKMAFDDHAAACKVNLPSMFLTLFL